MPLSDDILLFAATDVGRRRPHNEDSFLVDSELGLCIVADGMGGHAAGEVASATAIEFVHAELVQNRQALLARAAHGAQSGVTIRQVLALLESAIQTASTRIHAIAQGDSKKRGMGTTLSLLLVLDSLAYIAHVGDSRIYLGREGTLRQVTEDHTMAAEMLRLGMVTPDRIDKVPHRNAITRAVGIHPSVNVDTLTLEILPGDQFLLTSDGLTGYVQQDDDLLQRLALDDGEQAVGELIDFANAGGGKDNITALLLRVGSSDADDGARARRLALKRDVLADLPLFCRLGERELENLMQVVDVAEYGAGEEIVREGEAGDQLFVALSGRLGVRRGQTSLGELGPGEPIGEMALIRTTSRSATVTALEPSELVTLRRRDFFEVIRAEPEVAVKLLWQFVTVLADRLELTSEDLSAARDALAEHELAEDVIALVEVPTDSEAARPTNRLEDIEADPFSCPVPTPLGSFRLGYVPPGQENTPNDPPPVDPVPGDPGQGHGPPSALASRPQEPGGDGDENLPVAKSHPVASAKDTARSAGTDPPPPPRGPQGADDVKATLPFVRKKTRQSQSNDADQRPTVPAGEFSELRSEIDQLRKEFKERLRKSRDGGANNDSD